MSNPSKHSRASDAKSGSTPIGLARQTHPRRGQRPQPLASLGRQRSDDATDHSRERGRERNPATQHSGCLHDLGEHLPELIADHVRVRELRKLQAYRTGNVR